MSDCVKYIPKCCDTCTYLLHCADKECLSYSHYELDGCVAEEYRTAINQALADERQKILHDITCKAQKFIHPEYDERDEFFNRGIEFVLDIIDDYGVMNLRQQNEDEE